MKVVIVRISLYFTSNACLNIVVYRSLPIISNFLPKSVFLKILPKYIWSSLLIYLINRGGVLQMHALEQWDHSLLHFFNFIIIIIFILTVWGCGSHLLKRNENTLWFRTWELLLNSSPPIRWASLYGFAAFFKIKCTEKTRPSLLFFNYLLGSHVKERLWLILF